MRILLIGLILVLAAAPTWAGPLETSFHPALPKNLEFGDSPESIVSKMSRQPDTKSPELYVYHMEGTEHLPPSILEFKLANGGLQNLTLTTDTFTINHNHLEYSTEPIYVIYRYLKELYGEGQYCTSEAGCPYLSIVYWLQANNIMFLVPDSGSWSEDENKDVKMSIWLAPLASEGINLPTHMDITGCMDLSEFEEEGGQD